MKLYVICFGFKKTNKEISTIGGEIMNLFFQSLFYKLSLGQRSRQCLNKFYSIYLNNIYICSNILNKIYLSIDEVFDRDLVCKINFERAN